jgi:GNAT superfamily N-acetyltransferase
VAIANGEPVAMRGFFGSLWESGGSRFLVPCAADLVVDPAHRGRGLIAKLMGVAIDELAKEGYPYVFSLSAGEVTRIGAFTMGFKRVARVEEHVRVDRWRLVFGRRGRRRRRFARFDDWAASAKSNRMLSASAEPRAEAMASLIERLDYDGRLRHVRDATYLNWRYRNPNSEFRFIYSGGAALDGYIALAASRRRANKPVYVLDWEGTSLDVKRDLLDAALRFGGAPLLSVWAFGCTGAERKLLAERGFVPTERPGVKGAHIAVLVKPLESGTDPVGTAVRDATRWDYRMLYSDVC